MFVPIKLEGLIQEIEIQPEENSSYLNKKTGEIVTIGEEEMAAAEDDLPLEDFPDWQQEVILKAKEVMDTDDYVPLPSKFDINEWQIMERFCLSIADSVLGKMLHSAIKGAGAFQRFNDMIREHKLLEQWHEFREEALREILVDWCETQGIDYEK